LDKETGYYFYNARHYDPEIARFVTADSIIDGEFDTQGWNRFSYVKGNPILYKDPTGHKVEIEGTKEEYKKVIESLEYATGTSVKYKIKPVDKKKGIYSVDITGFKSTDKRFQNEQGYLTDLIKDKSTTTVKFDKKGEGGTAFTGGGSYDDEDQTVFLNPAFLKDKQDTFSYRHYAKSESKKGNILDRISRKISNHLLGKPDNTETKRINLDAWDTLAHELLGHAHDKITGKVEANQESQESIKSDSEARAVQRANIVRIKRNKPIRHN